MDWDKILAVLSGLANIATIISTIISSMPSPSVTATKSRSSGILVPKQKLWAIAAFTVLTIVFSLFGNFRSADEGSQGDRSYTSELPEATERVSNRTFTSERVVLDGKFFDGCTFINVTLVFNGTAKTKMRNPRLVGTNWLRTDNKAIDEFSKINEILKLSPGVTATGASAIDDDGNIVPIPSPVVTRVPSPVGKGSKQGK